MGTADKEEVTARGARDGNLWHSMLGGDVLSQGLDAGLAAPDLGDLDEDLAALSVGMTECGGEVRAGHHTDGVG